MKALVIKNVRVFDGQELLSGRWTVEIRDGVIQSLEKYRAHPIVTTKDTGTDKVLEGNGMLMMPGLIDAHTHVYQELDALQHCISFGVTTVFDLHNEPERAAWMKEQTRYSTRHPQVFSAFQSATIAQGWPRPIMLRHTQDPIWLEKLKRWPTLDSEESVEKFVASNKALGADIIKLMQESGKSLDFGTIPAPDLSLQSKVVEEAHKNSLLTVAHATNLQDTLLVLRAGVDGLAHQFFDCRVTREVVDEYRNRRAFLIPTLTAVNSFIGTPSSKVFYDSTDALQTGLDPQTQHCLCRGMNMALASCNVQYAYDCVKQLKKEGIDIVCGTDSAVGHHGTALGASLHHEMFMYVECCGMTPLEALSSATATSARRLGLADRGFVSKGKRADLILIDGDPTQDIRNSINVRLVLKHGALAYSSI